MQIKLIFAQKVLHLASFRKWELKSEMAYNYKKKIIKYKKSCLQPHNMVGFLMNSL